MPSATAAVSTAIALSAVVVAGLVLLRTRDLAVALPVLLDLLLAAGLLRLSATGSWRAIGAAAAVTAIRKVVVVGIRAGQGARHGPSPGVRGEA